VKNSLAVWCCWIGLCGILQAVYGVLFPIRSKKPTVVFLWWPIVRSHWSTYQAPAYYRHHRELGNRDVLCILRGGVHFSLCRTYIFWEHKDLALLLSLWINVQENLDGGVLIINLFTLSTGPKLKFSFISNRDVMDCPFSQPRINIRKKVRIRVGFSTEFHLWLWHSGFWTEQPRHAQCLPVSGMKCSIASCT
jgi:hypothetical protein